jgi:manganese efflux pump family protein
VVAILLVAGSLGLTNFSASIGIGIAGVDRRTRLLVAASFGVFEAGLPLVGLAIGNHIAGPLGSTGRYLGGTLLVAAGLYTLANGLRSGHASPWDELHLPRLLLASAVLGLDNLAVGFALGTVKVNAALAALVIGLVSVAMALAGLELGNRLGTQIGKRSELIGGAVLVGAGVATLAGVLA